MSKFSAEEILQISDNYIPRVYSYDLTKQKAVQIKTYLNWDEYGMLAKSVADAAFSDDGRYIPYVFNIMFSIKLVEAYVPDIELPDNAMESYEIIMKTGLYEKVITIVGETQQYKDVVKAVESMREYDIRKRLAKAMVPDVVIKSSELPTVDVDEPKKRGRKPKAVEE